MGTHVDQEPGSATLALVRRECRSIARALGRKRELHAGVHRARKAIRRLRSILALIDGRLEATAGIDRGLNRLGDGLSELRDAHVLVELAESFAREARQQWAPMVGHLTRRRDRCAERVLADDPGFARRRAEVRRLAADLDALDWQRLGDKHLAAGWKRGHKRVARAGRRARREPTPDHLHRLRRRMRRLRMQWDALRVVAPDVAGSGARAMARKDIKALRESIDRLGRLQDLRVLGDAVRDAADVPGRDALLRQLREALEAERARVLERTVGEA